MSEVVSLSRVDVAEDSQDGRDLDVVRWEGMELGHGHVGIAVGSRIRTLAVVEG